ncbi:YhgE/Pip domain-containing protein [Phytoactinopolyspora limicola]|uniref:YhgE/Pip domain-containing protein n=1 Tax=Phytoactinopolyspora limicola TaxID=2715536 RepID=UPI0014080C39|nr:YhgE/Pip domain-containing protein [Phytoactinopolyspora limicola]
MRALRLAGLELRRFRHPLQRLALGFLLLIPLLYGALYLWSNWDPYGRLDRIPVAVVNHDQPVTVDGEEVDAGERFIDELRGEPIFDWIFTDDADAADGLSAGRYYMTITIPEDFSADLASGAEDTPRRATVDLRRDDGNGYVFGIMADTARTTLQAQLDRAATTAYFESVYGNLDALRDGLVSAHDGAAELVDGLSQAGDGVDALVDGVGAAASGSAELTSGLAELATGSAELADGAAAVAAGNEQIADVVVPIIDEIVPVVPDVAAGAAAVTDAVAGLTELASGGSDTVADRTGSVVEQLEQLAVDDPELAADPGFQEVLDAAQAADDRAGEVADAVATVDDAAQELAADADTLQDRSAEIQDRLEEAERSVQDLASGSAEVASGAAELRDGIDAAHSGASDLDAAMGQLGDGAHELDSGLGQLSDGAGQLEAGLDDIVARIPAMSGEQRESAAQILGAPTEVTMTVDNDAELYGRGLAPFFFAIALWVFGIAAFVVLRPISGRALASAARPTVVALAGWLPVYGLALFGGLFLLVVCWMALGLDPVHPGWTVGLVALGAAAFTAIAHLLRLALGVVGTAIALVLLMLQLTSSAGVYPVETLPAPFQVLHPLLPMTYLVDGLRVAVTGGNVDHLLRDVVVLAGFLVVALVGTVVVVAAKRTWTMPRLHPVLEG